MAGNVMKKPLNQLQNPEYPDIKAPPTRFRSAGKHWTVDVGQALRDLEDFTQGYENAVLYQSKDWNKTNYGKSSFRQAVNHNFRPPLRTQEDIMPLSRLPRKPVIPRINPGGEDTYKAQNMTPTGIDSYLEDRVVPGQMDSGFYVPRDSIYDYIPTVMPDLQTKLPTHSAISFQESNFRPENFSLGENNLPVFLEDARPSTNGHAGFVGPYTVDGRNAPYQSEDFVLVNNLPRHSADAGYEAPFKIGGGNSGLDIAGGNDINEYLIDRAMPGAISSGYEGLGKGTPVEMAPTTVDNAIVNNRLTHRLGLKSGVHYDNLSSNVAEMQPMTPQEYTKEKLSYSYTVPGTPSYRTNMAETAPKGIKRRIRGKIAVRPSNYDHASHPSTFQPAPVALKSDVMSGKNGSYKFGRNGVAPPSRFSAF